MDQSHPKISILCDKCGHENVKTVYPVDKFDGPYLWSFWCQNCHSPVVVRYKYNPEANQWEIIERINPSEVYVQREPEPGITIKPKATKHRNK